MFAAFFVREGSESFHQSHYQPARFFDDSLILESLLALFSLRLTCVFMHISCFIIFVLSGYCPFSKSFNRIMTDPANNWCPIRDTDLEITVTCA